MRNDCNGVGLITLIGDANALLWPRFPPRYSVVRNELSRKFSKCLTGVTLVQATLSTNESTSLTLSGQRTGVKLVVLTLSARTAASENVSAYSLTC